MAPLCVTLSHPAIHPGRGEPRTRPLGAPRAPSGPEAGGTPPQFLSPFRQPLIHPCWFYSSLRPLDIEFMKRLSKVVNIVPVIAKADTLTLEERVYFKQRVGLHPLAG